MHDIISHDPSIKVTVFINADEEALSDSPLLSPPWFVQCVQSLRTKISEIQRIFLVLELCISLVQL